MKAFLLILTFFISLNLNGLKLDFKSNVKIKGEDIFVKDILEKKNCPQDKWNTISKIKVGNFASGENFLNLNSKTVNKKLKIYDIEVSKGFITIRKFRYSIDKNKFQEMAKNYLKQKYNLSEKDKIEFVSFPSLYSYKKNYHISFSEITSNNFNQIRRKCKVNDDDFKYQPEYFSVKVMKLQKCFVASKSIKLRDLIEIGKNVKEENQYFSLNNNAIHNIEELENVQSLKFLRKNQIIKENSIKRIPDVKRNSKVKILVENNIIKLEINAKATSDGYIGDVIAFRNIESNKNFKAKIIKKNLAIIKF